MISIGARSPLSFLVGSLACLSVLSLTACDSGLPPISWEGEKIRFATDRDDMPCGKTLHTLDGAVTWLEQQLSVPLTKEAKITYYWLSEEKVRRYCSGHGCARPHVVISSEPFNVHELAHALTLPVYQSHLFLDEGLAVAYGAVTCDQHAGSNLPKTVENSLVPYKRFDNYTYCDAGLFVRYLVERHGIEGFMAVYSLADPGSDYQDMNAIFRHALGVSLDEVLDTMAAMDWRALRCYSPPPMCLKDPIAWDRLSSHGFSLDCNGSDVVGPFTMYPQGGMKVFPNSRVLRVAFAVEEAGTYHLHADASEGVSGYADIRPCVVDPQCDGRPYESMLLGMHPAYSKHLSLKPGVYQIEAAAQVDDSAEPWVVFSLERTDSAF